jgi:hypothetical protein
MINAKQAREIVQNYVESIGNFHIAKIEELITKTAESGKYYISYKLEDSLNSEIRDFITEQILSAGFIVSWDGLKTKITISWRKE